MENKFPKLKKKTYTYRYKKHKKHQIEKTRKKLPTTYHSKTNKQSNKTHYIYRTNKLSEVAIWNKSRYKENKRGHCGGTGSLER